MGELESWLDQHKDEITLTDNNKVHCKLTGHDIPKRLSDLKQHWEGRVYRRAQKTAELAMKKRGVDFAKLAPHIIPHKKDPTKCFCKLTQLILNNDEEEVEAHMKGRKFQFFLSALKPKKKAKEATEDEDSLWARAPDLDEGEGDDEEDADSDPGFPHIKRARSISDAEGEAEGDEGDEHEDGEEDVAVLGQVNREEGDNKDDDNAPEARGTARFVKPSVGKASVNISAQAPKKGSAKAQSPKVFLKPSTQKQDTQKVATTQTNIPPSNQPGMARKLKKSEKQRLKRQKAK